MTGNHRSRFCVAVSVAGVLLCQATAGVVGHAGLPRSASGVAMSCDHPFKTIAVVRAKSATTVFQSTPKGIAWQVKLPPMQGDFDQYWMAPDGDGAVVAVSMSDGGRAYLVSPSHKPVEVAGVLSAVDFQPGLVLVATEGDAPGIRIRVFNRTDGAVVGDSVVKDVPGDGFRRFLFRLTEDGRAYYYLALNETGGEVPVVRNVADGKRYPLGFVVPGQVEDLVLQSLDSGVLAVSGNAYVVKNNRVSKVPANSAVGWIDQVMEPNGSGIHAVKGQRGWGVLNPETGAWLMSAPGGGHLYVGEAGVAMIDNSSRSVGMTSYQFSGMKPAKTWPHRQISGAAPEIACVNVFGAMTYENGKFIWNRSF